ncbi:hypothetical protein [Dactylosporangium sp. NPDC005555]|uniref:hypothetical protein n=1 Tax=Dactylosporangium sp. NPDC005555 TaxID=3154889 RepID=UPI0033BF6920
MTVTMSAMRRPVQRLGWPATLALHLLPVSVAFLFSAPLAFAVALPLQVGLLLRDAGSPGLLSFRRRLPLRVYLVLLPSLLAITFGVALLFEVDRSVGWLLAAAAVQQVYFHGYLLPRLPVDGPLAVVTSAGLSALLFGPLFGFAFVVQLLLTAVTVRFGSVRVGALACALLALAVLVL